jgi:copper(I)-binding protein
MLLRAIVLAAIFLTSSSPVATDQRTVKAADAWVTAAENEATAYVALENGTMYEVYLTGVETEIAQVVEMRQTTGGKANTVREVAIPAFDRVAMAADGTHLKLTGLKKPLKAGERVTLSLQFDSGDRLAVEAIVK